MFGLLPWKRLILRQGGAGLFSGVQIGNQDMRKFDVSQEKHLGVYIYALRDPRDKKIFYVGQGRGSRVFDHLVEAQGVVEHKKGTFDSKIMRIIDIWMDGRDVEWVIISYGFKEEDREIVSRMESCVYDALAQSQNGPALNSIIPPKSTLLTMEDMDSLATDFVNPPRPYERVFLFTINNTIKEGKVVYEATRKEWKVAKTWRDASVPAYAVGLDHGVSVGSYRIEDWKELDSGKFEFSGIESEYDDFKNKKWVKIIHKAKGFFGFGGFLIVSFDGKGKARILRGAQDKGPFDLID